MKITIEKRNLRFVNRKKQKNVIKQKDKENTEPYSYDPINKNATIIKNNLKIKIFLHKAIDCYGNVIKINTRKYL